MTDKPDLNLLKYPFGQHPDPPQPPVSEEQIFDALDYEAMEQDVFLLTANLLTLD